MSADRPGIENLLVSRHVLFRIKLPKGSNAVFLGGVNPMYGKLDDKNQNEILIARGQTFRYVDLRIISLKGQEALIVTLETKTNNIN